MFLQRTTNTVGVVVRGGWLNRLLLRPNSMHTYQQYVVLYVLVRYY